MRIRLILCLLCSMSLTSCGPGGTARTDDEREARRAKADDQFMDQINEWTSKGLNLNEPQSFEGYKELPIIFAASGFFVKSAEYLLSHSATAAVNSVSTQMSPLDLAASNSRCSEDSAATLAENLLQHGADVNHKGDLGNTPLIIAALDRHPKVAAVLIAHGANVNDQNTNGMNALHIAASNGDVETVKVLVVHGADLTVKTPSGATALALAKFGPTLQSGQKDPKQDYDGTAKLLQEHGAP